MLMIQLANQTVDLIAEKEKGGTTQKNWTKTEKSGVSCAQYRTVRGHHVRYS